DLEAQARQPGRYALGDLVRQEVSAGDRVQLVQPAVLVDGVDAEAERVGPTPVERAEKLPGTRHPERRDDVFFAAEHRERQAEPGRPVALPQPAPVWLGERFELADVGRIPLQ